MTSRLVEEAFDRQVKTWRWTRTTGSAIVANLLRPSVARQFDKEMAAVEEARRHSQEILLLERVSGHAATFALADDIGNATWVASMTVPNETVLEETDPIEPIGFVWSETPLRIPAYVSDSAVESDGYVTKKIPRDEPFEIPAQGFAWYVINNGRMMDHDVEWSEWKERGTAVSGVYMIFVGAGEEFARIAGIPPHESSTSGCAQIQYSLFWRFGDSLETMRTRSREQAVRLKLGDEFETNQSALDRAKFAWSFWRFIQQDILRRNRQPVNRQRQRRLKRNGWPGEPMVDVVELRRRRYEPSGMTDEQRKEWSCRWLVSGHWRRQFYRSTGEYKTIWISGYVKGPDDKPLLVKGPRVYAVVR